MIGGQVLIIFVGGEAFKIVRLDGKEWGLSIGLGALSLPVGALIRLTPDSWIASCLPWSLRKAWAPETISEGYQGDDENDDFRPPLRVMSSIRGKRVEQHIGFRARLHEIKEKTKEKINVHEKQDGTVSKV
jgi:Ca2+-transporting ATPase